VVVITPQGTITPAGTLPRLKSFKVRRHLRVGMSEFDSGLALINLEDAQKLYRLDGVSGVRSSSTTVRRAAGRAGPVAEAAVQARDPRLDAQPREFLSAPWQIEKR
jgi:ABC-type lipoprotein release transport system permease subunit